MKRLAISFSGGETSAFMAQRILRSDRVKQYDEVKVTFANTGQENEETLEFVRDCDKAFGLGVVWVEAIIHPGERKAPTARIVNFETASRNGEPFEAGIQKYGIPNPAYKHCTRTLKEQPMASYLAECGWAPGTFDTAIGIRVDEIDRMSPKARAHRLVYPLVSWWPTTKPDINGWWARQPFRLRLKGYQGNCKTCWKKSTRKLLTIMRENPGAFDFFERMEKQYARTGPEFVTAPKANQTGLPPEYRRTFFREGRDVAALRELLAANPDMEGAEDDSQTFSVFDPTFDLGGACEESCEVYADDDAEKAA